MFMERNHLGLKTKELFTIVKNITHLHILMYIMLRGQIEDGCKRSSHVAGPNATTHSCFDYHNCLASNGNLNKNRKMVYKCLNFVCLELITELFSCHFGFCMHCFGSAFIICVSVSSLFDQSKLKLTIFFKGR
jgi:hypothetical protein